MDKTYEHIIDTGRDKQYFYVLSLEYPFHEALERYKRLLIEINDKQQMILFERIFGYQRYRHKVISVVRDVIKKKILPEHPVSFIEGGSVSGMPIAGIIIHAVGSETAVRYIQDQGTVYGSYYQIGSVERLSVEGIQDPLRASGFSRALSAEYNQVNRIILSAGFDTTDLVRTWHYIHPIEDYILFNHERKNFFKCSNIDFLKQPESVPASTCIEGKCWKTGYSAMNLYYVKRSTDVEIRRIYNSGQKEADSHAYQYGPTFSRALHAVQPGFEELQISGTASIGEDGITRHVNDPDRQIERTLLMVKGLLQQASMGFSDISYATCIFKHASDYSVFREVVQRLHIPDFPYIPIQGNICRDDLLFELDGIATKKRGD